MADQNDVRRMDVLQAFTTACQRPTIDDIADWVDRHPEFADDIRRRAETALEVAQTADPTAVPSDELVRRSRAIATKHLRTAFAAATQKRRRHLSSESQDL